jgi:hypothetical protein
MYGYQVKQLCTDYVFSTNEDVPPLVFAVFAHDENALGFARATICYDDEQVPGCHSTLNG